MNELGDERTAARSAITRLHLTPTMFEIGARPHPPRELYRAYLAQSDVFVGIYWQQYGWVAPGETISGLEDEYRLAGDKPKLIYVKAAADREPRLVELLRLVKADDRASYKPFSTAEDLAEILADDLAVLLTERFASYAVQVPQSLRKATLPVPLTELVDRVPETSAIGLLLADPTIHLVTITGSGGIGKTRLALEVARNWWKHVPQGSAWFVDLAPLKEPALWVEALASALGVWREGSNPVLDLIIDRLQGRPTLIVFDNFEQLLPVPADFARFLTSCPDMTLLVTSRSALNIRGESEIALAPLDAPAADAAGDIEVIGRSAAVQLLIARAATVRPGFSLTASNASAVAELCQRLDGIPLALELAAAQLRVLTPAALLQRLGPGRKSSLDLTGGPVDLPDRQRTLRATIEWSYGLLTDVERVMLARLSIFTSAWTVEGAGAVGTVADDLDAIATLGSLVAQSLVRIDESDCDEPRFRMLDTIRAYAAERLVERGEVDATNARLARHLVSLVEGVHDALQGPEHRAVDERLDRERDEIRAAIEWALHADDADTVARLLMPLFTYWWSRGPIPMTHDFAEKAALLPSASHLTPCTALLLLAARGMAMLWVGRMAEAEPLLRDTLAAAIAIGHERLRAYASLGLGWALAYRASAEACDRLDDAARIFDKSHDYWGLTSAWMTRGLIVLVEGDAAAARAIHEKALDAAETIDNDYLRAQILDMLGLDATAIGDLDGAWSRYAAAAELHERLLDYEGSANGLSGLAGLALARNRPDASARLIGASRAARDLIGIPTRPAMKSTEDARDAATRVALQSAPFAAALAEGARLRLKDAFAYGLAATTVDAVLDPVP